MKERSLASFRRENLGFVFQEFNLLDAFSLKDNILLPLVLSGQPVKDMERRLAPIAQALGIVEILSKFPYEVSGGQKQLVALARLALKNPQVVLLDEPTSDLDQPQVDFSRRADRRAGQRVIKRPAPCF